MNPDDVAQNIALQYRSRLTEPMSLHGWVATATRCRLIDLARKKRPVTVDYDALFQQMKHQMETSAVSIPDQYQRIIATLRPAQQAVINEHLTGATNAQIARSHDYASEAVASAIISRIKKKLQAQFPEIIMDLAPQRVY